MENVYLVNLFWGNNADRPSHGIALNLIPQGHSAFLCQLLRVVELCIVVAIGKNHRGRIDASGQTTTASLITTGLYKTFIKMWRQFSHDI